MAKLRSRQAKSGFHLAIACLLAVAFQTSFSMQGRLGYARVRFKQTSTASSVAFLNGGFSYLG